MTGLVVENSSQAKQEDADESLSAILSNSILCSLATNGTGGVHINTAFFAFVSDPRLDLYILTPPSTLHAQNIRENPSVALTVFESTQPWGSDLSGCQLHGRALLVEGVDSNEGFQAYTQRFPGVLEYARTREEMDQVFESRFYRISIETVKLLDERRFGKENYVTGRF
jgi:uncharacterized protein